MMMVKLLLALSLFTSFLAWSKPLVIPDMYQMSTHEKKIMVKLIMRYMVDVESRFIHLKETNNTKTVEYKNLKEILYKFYNILLEDAHAQSDQLQNGLSYYRTAKSKIGTNRCLYAGWISETYYDSNRKRHVCRHPKFKGESIYPKNNCASHEISCHPDIFGYEDNQSKLFCVDAYPKHHNSSLSCMTKALNEGDKEQRLEQLANKLLKQEFFDEVYAFILRACLCDDSKSTKIESSYQGYMKPHRTCYALMNQLRRISQKACTIQDLDTSVSDNLLELLKPLETLEESSLTHPDYKVSTTSFDNDYKKIMSQIEGDHKELKDNLCKDDSSAFDIFNKEKKKEESEAIPEIPEEEASEPEEEKAEEAAFKYSVEVDHPCELNTCKVNALINGKAELLEHSIKWKRKAPEEILGDGLSYQAPRKESDYDVCADFIKDGQTKDTQCVTITKKSDYQRARPQLQKPSLPVREIRRQAIQ